MGQEAKTGAHGNSKGSSLDRVTIEVKEWGKQIDSGIWGIFWTGEENEKEKLADSGGKALVTSNPMKKNVCFFFLKFCLHRMERYNMNEIRLTKERHATSKGPK